MIKLRAIDDTSLLDKGDIWYTTQEKWETRTGLNDPNALLPIWKKPKDVGVYHKKAVSRVKWFEVIV